MRRVQGREDRPASRIGGFAAREGFVRTMAVVHGIESEYDSASTLGLSQRLDALADQ